MCRAFAFHHRVHKPALQLEPVIGLLFQVGDRMLSKKFPTDMFLRCLTGQRFNAVLTKFEQMSIFIGARPGAALAIEAALFVHSQPIGDSTSEAGFPRCEFQALEQSVHSGCDPIRRAQFRLCFFFRRLRSKRSISARFRFG